MGECVQYICSCYSSNIGANSLLGGGGGGGGGGSPILYTTAFHCIPLSHAILPILLLPDSGWLYNGPPLGVPYPTIA